AITARFVRAHPESTFAMIPVVATRIGRVRGMLQSPLRAVLIVVLVLVGAALSLALLLGRWRRRAALLCALVALLNAAARSLLTPVFQIPAELSHTSYVQDLAVKHSAPSPHEFSDFSPELQVVVNASAVGAINFNGFAKPTWDAQGEKLAEAPFKNHPT